MKIKEGFMMHKVGDRAVAVAVGENTKNFHGMINLNKTEEFLWKQLENERTKEELLDAVTEAFDVERSEAEKGLEGFLGNLREAGVLKE